MKAYRQTPKINTIRSITVMATTVGILLAVNSTLNIVWAELIYSTVSMYRALLPNDCINLFLGVPVLFLSVRLTLQRSRIGPVAMAASLLFVLYNEISYLFAFRNTFSFVINTAMTLMCLAAIVRLAVSMRQSSVQMQPTVRRSRVFGVILIAMGAVFVARALMNIRNAGAIAMPLWDMGVNIADAILCSLWIVCGILLIGKPKNGGIPVFVCFFHGSMLFLALLLFMIMQPLVCGTEFVLADFLVILLMSMTFVVPLILFIRGLAKEAQYSKQMS